jgi:Flp pilus assembly pilin Flp
MFYRPSHTTYGILLLDDRPDNKEHSGGGKGEGRNMTKVYVFLMNLAGDRRGQDMVEYALLAGFVAVAAGAILPNVANSLNIIFSKMASVTSVAATK